MSRVNTVLAGLNQLKSVIGDSVLLDPIPTTDLLQWYKSDAGLFIDSAGNNPVSSDGDAVGRVNDQSGNGFDINQATSSRKPTYKTSILNSLPSIRFDGTDDFLTSISNITPAPTTVFAVASCEAFPQSINIRTLYRYDSDGATILATITQSFFQINFQYFNNPIGTLLNIPNLWNNTNRIHVGRFDTGNDMHQWINDGTSDSKGSDPGSITWDNKRFTLGSSAFNTPSSVWENDVFELIAYGSVLSNSDINTIAGGYLAPRYGLSWSSI